MILAVQLVSLTGVNLTQYLHRVRIFLNFPQDLLMVDNHRILLLMPALNEERGLDSLLQQIPEYIDKLILVDDGSEDLTAEIAKKHGATIVTHATTRGLGVAFLNGLKEALKHPFDILVNMDSDGQFNPADISKLINPIIQNSADFVTASRFIDEDLYPAMPKSKFYGNRYMAKFISFLTGQKFHDVSCGFRAYSFDTVLKINLFGSYTYTQESFLDLSFKGARIVEVPVKVLGERENGKSRIASNLFKYGYNTFAIIVRSFRDYKPLRLFLYLAVICSLLSFGFGVFLGIHYIKVGVFTPHKWAGFVGGFFFIIGLLFTLIGFILDMFARMRLNQELLLYELKKNDYLRKNNKL